EGAFGSDSAARSPSRPRSCRVEPEPRRGAVLIAVVAWECFQSARNSWDFPPGAGFDVQQSFRPSGENVGRPSKPSLNVTRAGSRVPAASTMNNSKLEKPSLLAVKMTYLPEGW